MRALVPVTLVALALAAPASAELRGHGGPVRALAVTADGAQAISGSFDTTLILWSLGDQRAQTVLRFHDGSVNAVTALPDGRFASAGEDGRIALWQLGEPKPVRVLSGHSAPVAALANDGRRIASASWDGTVRLWSVENGASQILEGHKGNVNGVAFLADGRLASVGYDATLRIWPEDDRKPPVVLTLPTPLNALAATGDALAVGGGDGRVRIVGPDGRVRAQAQVSETPVIALAAAGGMIAAAGLRGAIAVMSAPDLSVVHMLRGPGLPVWSLAFRPGGRELLTGGNDRIVRRWDLSTGEHIGEVVAGGPADPLAAFAGDRGAEVYRACVACHTLRPDEGVRAGPTLHGIFGRRIASVPDYDYSPAFRGLDITWSPETVSRLFEIGPAAYTPGTKMPEQRVTSAADRAALMDFLERATGPY